jgi:protein TonB
MDDRVGDALASRASLEGSAALGIALSILLHGALTGAAVWAALRHGTTQTAGVMMIKFASLPRAPKSTSTALRPANVAPKPAPLEKPDVPKPKTVAPAPAKPEKNVVPFSPFGKSNKKGSEQATPSVATAPVEATKPGVTTQVPVGGSGVTGLEGGDFPYTIYIDRMKTLIGSHWYRPQSSNATTTIHYVINRDGSLRDVRVETSSGDDNFDRAALRAVRETSPLPPLPFGYDGTYLGVHLTFR